MNEEPNYSLVFSTFFESFGVNDAGQEKLYSDIEDRGICQTRLQDFQLSCT